MRIYSSHCLKCRKNNRIQLKTNVSILTINCQ
ncbi:MAG: hypothetical protein K6A77_08525 [Clostridiales bacterium]|nr:hypothetical protein [Clostridiales bacterium]